MLVENGNVLWLLTSTLFIIIVFRLYFVRVHQLSLHLTGFLPGRKSAVFHLWHPLAMRWKKILDICTSLEKLHVQSKEKFVRSTKDKVHLSLLSCFGVEYWIISMRRCYCCLCNKIELFFCFFSSFDKSALVSVSSIKNKCEKNVSSENCMIEENRTEQTKQKKKSIPREQWKYCLGWALYRSSLLICLQFNNIKRKCIRNRTKPSTDSNYTRIIP